MSAVIISLPVSLANGAQISVVTSEDISRPEVLVRAASNHTWVPLSHIEGTFEVRG